MISFPSASGRSTRATPPLAINPGYPSAAVTIREPGRRPWGGRREHRDIILTAEGGHKNPFRTVFTLFRDVYRNFKWHIAFHGERQGMVSGDECQGGFGTRCGPAVYSVHGNSSTAG